MSANTARAVEAWNVAARELGIEVVAPFRFTVDKRDHECLAWVAHFGQEKGLILVGIEPPDFATDQAVRQDARCAGYQWSAVDLRTYAEFNRDKFIGALLDWGFTGPPEKRPAWLESSDAAEHVMRQAAEGAAEQLARSEGLLLQHTFVGQEVMALPSGERGLSVVLTLQDGSQRSFEYRCDTSGAGRLWPVDGT